MAICIKCGKENDFCLCDSCRNGADLEALCQELIAYKPGSGENPIWENLCSEFNSSVNLRNLVFAVSDYLPTPRKEYQRVLAIAAAFSSASTSNVPKDSRQWFYEIYETIKDNDGLTEDEKNRLHGIALGAFYMDYDYSAADKIASRLSESEDIPWQACYNLAEFYINTRRYDAAGEVIADALRRFENDTSAVQTMQSCAERNKKQREKAEAGKPEYMPNPRENRDEVRQKYVDFLESIGIEAAMPKPRKKAPTPIPLDQYPNPVETREADFDSFVAFDLETTGLSSSKDSIIEIGAIRVCGGQVIEKAEFIFQELVKPYKQKISDEIQQLTGITADDVKDAREMWEVFEDFMKFAGDDILLGFNCMAFDSKFMVRAGRYARIKIQNKYFDVKRYATQFKEQLDIIDARTVSLEELSEKLDIENPQAHRALADAVTTARVYLKLKEMDGGSEKNSVNDLLSDLDNW